MNRRSKDPATKSIEIERRGHPRIEAPGKGVTQRRAWERQSHWGERYGRVEILAFRRLIDPGQRVAKLFFSVIKSTNQTLVCYFKLGSENDG